MARLAFGVLMVLLGATGGQCSAVGARPVVGGGVRAGARGLSQVVQAGNNPSSMGSPAPSPQQTSSLVATATPSADQTAEAPSSDIPYPTAFFPLADDDLASMVGTFTGTGTGTTFQFDSDANFRVLQCSQADNSSVTLPPIMYGQGGQWAINLWIQNSDAAAGPEAVFSHRSRQANNTIASVWGPDQVYLYFPGLPSPWNGILRTVVKDDNDVYSGVSSVTYLDSDGLVSFNGRNASNSRAPQVDLADGGWHMLTLTTFQGGSQGFQLYVDGVLSGQMMQGRSYNGSDGYRHQSTGGGPMEMDGDIFLCSNGGRQDGVRGFNGRMVELAIWDSALSASQIGLIFTQGIRRESTPAAPAPAPATEDATAENTLANTLGLDAPVAFFPLTGSSLKSDASFGGGNYTGQGYNITWANDENTGNVLECSKAMDSMVVLDPVAYGRQGPWAINLWFKPAAGGLYGDQFEYLYSHANKYTQYITGWEANQVRLYFPELAHPAFGIIRALVKDSTDNTTTLAGQTFLDSDGLVGQLVRNTTSTALEYGASLLQSNHWHMISLTTLRSSTGTGKKGFAMYLDGQLVAQMSSDLTYLASDGSARPTNGGDPMDLSGNIVLCGRSTGDLTRGYDGRLAELAIWNSALSAAQIRAIYEQGLGNTALAPATSDAALPTTVEGQVVCLLNPITALPLQDCARNEVCVALSTAAIEAAKLPVGVHAGDVGVCQLPLAGGLLLPNASVVAPARAFYPLTNVYTSYPLPDLVANTSGVLSVPDAIFTYASRCSRDFLSQLAFPSVPYAALGAFSVNFWFKADNVSGAVMEYLFSQADGDVTGTGPNQVQIYFPQNEHPAFGIVRSYVTDTTDNTTTMVYLDSDGHVNDNGPRVTIDPGAAASLSVSNNTSVSDGEWHQITVTSQPNATKGYRIYVDGMLGGEISSARPPKDANGTSLPVTGGGPLDDTGPSFMCSREDNNPQRHFDGLIAYLGLYDFALKPDQVLALNTAVMTQPLGMAPTTSAVSSLRTDDGQLCNVPTNAQGLPLWTECPMVNGVRACPVKGGGQWEPCATSIASAAAATAPSPTGVTSVAGQQCQLPLLYEGEAVEGCVTFALSSKLPVCWTAGHSWVQCAAKAPTSVSNIPVASSQERLTSMGEQCGLPVVYQGVIVTDCIFIGGSQACPASNGVWTKCASRSDTSNYAPVVAAQPTDVTVTNRTTVSGKACRLPFVSNGSLVVDCININNSSQCMGEVSRQWEQCAQVTDAPQRESLEQLVQTGSTADGAVGSLCLTKADAGHGCQAGLVCVPLPVQTSGTVTSLYASQPASNTGSCTPASLGYNALVRALQPISSHEVPQPLAFFPLVGGQLDSIMLPQYKGSTSNGSWVPDNKFDQVYNCSKASQTSMRIEPVNFATSGAWTVNIWFKMRPGLTDTTPNSLGYLVSMTSSATAIADATQANQIQIFLPGKQNVGYGVVRTVVKDSKDGATSGSSAARFVYLDSNGLVNGNTTSPTEVNPNDGQWHMATVSSQPQNFAGYRFFVDGQLVGDLSGNSSSATRSSPVQIGGGAPIYLNNPITLCARSDLDPNRYLDGSVAHLALYDSVLSDQQVSRLYAAYTTGPDPAPAVGPAAGSVAQISAQGGGQVTKGSHSNAGAIVGGIFGALAGLLLVGLLAFFLIRRRRSNKFEPFKDAPMAYNQSQLPSFSSGEVELRPAPRIEKIEDNGFGGNRASMRSPFVDQAEGILKDSGGQGTVNLPADGRTPQLHPGAGSGAELSTAGSWIADAPPSNGKASFLSEGPEDAQNFENRPSFKNTLSSTMKEA